MACIFILFNKFSLHSHLAAAIASSPSTPKNDHSSKFGISSMIKVSSMGKAAPAKPVLPNPQPINSGPIFVTDVAPLICRYFRLGSTLIGGSKIQDLQRLRVRNFNDAR